MDYASDLLGVNSEQAFRFFFGYLQNEVATKRVAKKETTYVAGVLAHYAQTSRSNPNFMVPSGSLYEILDNFVLPAMTPEGALGLQDAEILEVAGSHTLFLVGFFRDQMKKRHSLKWYDSLGQSFFVRASANSNQEEKAELLWAISEHFPFWAASCRNMSRTLRDERYLLRLDS
jgi:hypothetical protein